MCVYIYIYMSRPRLQAGDVRYRGIVAWYKNSIDNNDNNNDNNDTDNHDDNDKRRNKDYHNNNNDNNNNHMNKDDDNIVSRHSTEPRSAAQHRTMIVSCRALPCRVV